MVEEGKQYRLDLRQAKGWDDDAMALHGQIVEVERIENGYLCRCRLISTTWRNNSRVINMSNGENLLKEIGCTHSKELS